MVVSTLPDFGSPGAPTFVSALLGFAGTAHAFWLGKEREEIFWAAFVGAFIGAAIGFSLYAVSLVAGLY